MTKINSDLYSEMSLTAGDDAWAWCLGWHFAIAETLFILGEDTPEEWQFRPSPVIVQGRAELLMRSESEDYGWEDSAVANLCLHYGVTAEDLTYAGNVLFRYAGLLRALGKDY